ncbi:MAG: GNAT family protein [Burkholderiaceae bacterium]
MSLELVPLTREGAPAAEDFFAAVDESRASLTHWMPWCHAGYGRADVERWFGEADRMWRERSAFHMWLRDGVRVLGVVGIHDIQRYGKSEGELGYWVRLSVRGRGVASTALRSMAAFAFNELNLVRVSMRIRLDNASSRRAAERAGARYEGALRHGIVHGEARYDAALYALLPGDLARKWAP